MAITKPWENREIVWKPLTMQLVWSDYFDNIEFSEDLLNNMATLKKRRYKILKNVYRNEKNTDIEEHSLKITTKFNFLKSQLELYAIKKTHKGYGYYTEYTWKVRLFEVSSYFFFLK